MSGLKEILIIHKIHGTSRSNNNQANSSNENVFADHSSRIRKNVYNTIIKKKSKKDIMAFFLTLLIFITIFLLLWIIPFTRKYLVDIYNNNFVIKGFIDIFLK